ncbi:hypothetical protein EV356DRAFT_569755 [Viridothelium virens]|uniref:Uncharacterized protein n=1 Tax=Viridothelium virens TaxID=1048519 RepID=A0A6A6H0S3_VIRVR|nr:hypothetical protein EV356DRAFT_569755 [Viridothelium virens]
MAMRSPYLCAIKERPTGSPFPINRLSAHPSYPHFHPPSTPSPSVPPTAPRSLSTARRPQRLLRRTLSSRTAIASGATAGPQPGLTELRTHDLSKLHPDREKRAKGTWRLYGRADDPIILASGRKFNSIAEEATVATFPLLTDAVIVGEPRGEEGGVN